MAQNVVGTAPTVNIEQYPRAQAFVKRCCDFFDEVKNL
jgi:hypothetical protein